MHISIRHTVFLAALVIAANERTWEPGPRVLSKRSGVAWTMTTPEGRGSDVRLDGDHVVTTVTDHHLTLTLVDEGGVVIHVTTYMVQH